MFSDYLAVICEAKYVAAIALIFENLENEAMILKSIEIGTLFSLTFIQGCL